jgi:hypothetical protein
MKYLLIVIFLNTGTGAVIAEFNTMYDCEKQLEVMENQVLELDLEVIPEFICIRKD